MSTIFATNNSCILSPEVTEGPYCKLHGLVCHAIRDSADEITDVAGEYLRQNITEGQKGVDLTFDVQILNVNTCKPVPNVYVEIWRMFLPVSCLVKRVGS
jgi:protocatechuate 3,4-dioxygenase beta subunit